jgi:hypothetical protein
MAALRAVELRRLLVRRIGGEAVLPPTLTWRARPASNVAPEDGALAGRSAYEVLGVGETSPYAEIKASFHRLAKETHQTSLRLPVPNFFRSLPPTRYLGIPTHSIALET